MSETVRYRGSIKKIELVDDETYEDRARIICIDNGIPLLGWQDSYIECLCDERGDIYAYVNGVLYDLIKNYEDEVDYFANAYYAEDGSIKYHVCYYNGGAGFEEVLEEAINKLK